MLSVNVRRRSGQDRPFRVYEAPSACFVGHSSELAGLSAIAILSAPVEFYGAGDRTLLGEAIHRVAIVGTRDASADGLRRARKLAKLAAAEGFVVVSGLAKGIDRAAHEAAIGAGGRTIAVIGTPLDRAYPAENAGLQEDIYSDHLLLSQFPSGSNVTPTNFVTRNSFMAAISHASVIVEAGETSGTHTQARETQRLGRPLFLMRSVLESGLRWPQRYLDRGAMILDDVSDLVRVVRSAS